LAYGLFALLSHRFNIAIAIVVEAIFAVVVIGLFEVGRRKESHSHNPFRPVFTAINTVSVPSSI
jgi:hypothetical protein